jgi:hypothetical protein
MYTAERMFLRGHKNHFLILCHGIYTKDLGYINISLIPISKNILRITEIEKEERLFIESSTGFYFFWNY